MREEEGKKGKGGKRERLREVREEGRRRKNGMAGNGLEGEIKR